MSENDSKKFISLGEDVYISPTAVFTRANMVSIGSHVAIDHGVYVTTQAEIGDYIHLSPYITVIGGAKSKVIIENFATVAAGTRIIAGSDAFLGEGLTSVTVPEKYRDTVNFSTIKIEKFVGVGTNVVIMPGVKLAEGCVIGANSLVTKDTEPWTIYMGSPAKPIKKRNKEKMLLYAKELGY